MFSPGMDVEGSMLRMLSTSYGKGDFTEIRRAFCYNTTRKIGADRAEKKNRFP